MTSRLRLAETRATRAILRRRDRAKRLEDSGFSGDKGKPSPSSARRAARRSVLIILIIDGKETETDGQASSFRLGISDDKQSKFFFESSQTLIRRLFFLRQASLKFFEVHEIDA